MVYEEKDTKWVNEIPIKYKELFENYKNIELFQNIHNDIPNEKVIEGFNFFEDFDMHKKRSNKKVKIPGLRGFFNAIENIKNFILCPFYKSDQIIDKGIQKLLKIFIAVECTDLSMNLFKEMNEDQPTLDLSDLIDDELLYSANPTSGSDGRTRTNKDKYSEEKTSTTTDTTATTDLSNNTDWFSYLYERLTKLQSNNGNSDEFGIDDLKQLGNIYSQSGSNQEKVVEGMKQNIKSVTERQRRRDREREARVNKRIEGDFKKIYNATKVDCNASKEKAENDIKRYAGTIRNQIYNILFLPIILLIFYNCYYMFFYTDVSGFKPSFVDIERQFYEPYLKPYLNFFLGIFIKPVSVLYYIFNLISTHKTSVRLSKEYPYYFFIILFVIVYSIISQSGKNIISTWGDMLFTSKTNPFTPFALIIMGFHFLFGNNEGIFTTLAQWKDESQRPISGSIKFITYWVIRLIINILIFPYAGYLCTVYVFVYLFLGIYISQDSEPFDTINEINDTIYDKIYKAFDEKCGNKGNMAFIIKYFIRFLFMYLFEITLIVLLFISIGVFREKINNPNLLAFLFAVILSLLFIIGVWCLTKYYTVLPMLDEKYTLTSKSYFQNKKEDPAEAAAEAAAEAEAEAKAEAEAAAAAGASATGAAAATNATVNATENTADILSTIGGIFAGLLGAK